MAVEHRPVSRPSILGETVVSVRSASGRRWRVQSYSASTDEYKLVPMGYDVSDARSGETGRWQGGVRRIWVDYERLHDERFWRRVA